jgi:hypothetical protein
MLPVNPDQLKTFEPFAVTPNPITRIASSEKKDSAFTALLKTIRNPLKTPGESNIESSKEGENPNGEITAMKVTESVIIPNFTDGTSFEQKKAIVESVIQTLQNETRSNPQLKFGKVEFKMIHLNEKAVMIQAINEKGVIKFDPLQQKFFKKLISNILEGVN